METNIPYNHFDADGFMRETDAWDEGLARRIAGLPNPGEEAKAYM